MNLFQIVKVVLDEQYEQIALSCENAKDEAIRYELKVLREKYPELSKGATIDYNSKITRFAYIYRYVVAHANNIYMLIKNVPELSYIFDGDNASVSCLGGGPGSDILGILKFIKMKEKTTSLTCRVYDRQERWRESLSSFCNLLSSYKIVPFFRALDATDRATRTKYLDLWDTNLFTISYFLSELYSMQEQAEDFFKTLFDNAKQNTLFLFVDNSSGYSCSWLDRLVVAYNRYKSYGCLKLLRKEDQYGFRMAINEHVEDLDPYFSKFGDFEHPRLNTRVDYRIYRKA